jgi:hypothetical protein
MRDRAVWASLVVGTVLSLLACYGIASRSLILGAPGAGWFYGYVEEFSVRPLGAALLVTGVAGALLFFLPSRRPWLAVAIWIVAATGLHVLLRSLTPFTLEEIFVSDATNSFYSVTMQFDARTVLDSFQEVRDLSPLHVQSNMPGKLMLLYGLESLTRRTDVLAWLVLVISNLGALLVFGFVRDLFEDEIAALYAAVLYLFVPARMLFFPLMNTVTPLIVFGCAWALVRWLKTGKDGYAALLGVLVYLLVFFEPLPLVMGVLFAALIGRAVHQREIAAAQVLRQIGVGALAFCVTYVAMYLWFGFELVDALRQVSGHAVEFNVLSARPYGRWVRENLREFAFGAGLCQIAVFAAALGDAAAVGGSWRSRLVKPAALLTVSVLAVIVITDLIGVNRGEVVRLWIFLACFVQIPVAWVCARLRSPIAVLIAIATSALQAALGTAMIGFAVLA